MKEAIVPKYALADECIDEMRKVARILVGRKSRSNDNGEAVLSQSLTLRLKRSPDDEGIFVELARGITLNFFRRDAPAQSSVARRKNEPLNPEHFFVQVGDKQYTFKTVLECNKVLGVMVREVAIPLVGFSPDTSCVATLNAPSG